MIFRHAPSPEAATWALRFEPAPGSPARPSHRFALTCINVKRRSCGARLRHDPHVARYSLACALACLAGGFAYGDPVCIGHLVSRAPSISPACSATTKGRPPTNVCTRRKRTFGRQGGSPGLTLAV
jgi:hypothetical protein